MADKIQPWLVEMAIVPVSQVDQEKLAAALITLVAEDPSFQVAIDSGSGETLLRGRDEIHLDSKVDILKRIHKIDVNVGAPQVGYREAITRRAEVDYAYKKITGATGQFARVILEIEPNERGKGCAFESRAVPEVVPEEFIPGVEMGLSSVMVSGVVAGFPLLDVKVSLVDGAYHEVDSSAAAFEIAARVALCEGLRKAGPVLLEPVMKVEVATSEAYLGGVIGDLNARLGRIVGTGTRGREQTVEAMVPLASMLGYAGKLHLMSQGRASFIMHFDHYAPVPSPDDSDPPPFRPAMGMRA